MSTYQSSPLKWAGSKQNMLHNLLPILEKHKKKVFVEPFIGAANVSLNFPDCEMYIWNDLNRDLTNTYEVIRGDTHHYVGIVRGLFDEGVDKYSEYRDHFNNIDVYTDNSVMRLQRASLFQYLNKHCFNGLCRYNKRGGFNVPVGSGGAKSVPVGSIEYTRKFLTEKEVDICNVDFEVLFKNISRMEDVLVYLDPPYVSLNSDFNYTKEGFGLDKQEKLKQLAKDSKHTVVISNHWTEYTQELYKDADEVYVFPVRRTISCKGGGRKPVEECVVVYYGVHR